MSVVPGRFGIFASNNELHAPMCPTLFTSIQHTHGLSQIVFNEYPSSKHNEEFIMQN